MRNRRVKGESEVLGEFAKVRDLYLATYFVSRGEELLLIEPRRDGGFHFVFSSERFLQLLSDFRADQPIPVGTFISNLSYLKGRMREASGAVSPTS